MRRLTSGSAVLAGTLIAAIGPLRKRSLTWGATDEEARRPLPGDGLLPANLTSTRAISIAAPPSRVWPWLAQLGQGRGGFYSYDWLENLAGCRIHSADRVVPEWQRVQPGDEIRLAPQVALSVALVEPGRALVLRGGIPMGRLAAPYDFTWAFIPCDDPGGGTRLLVRERYAYLRRWAPLMIEPTELVSLVMSRRMLQGIRSRSERADSP